MKTDKTAVVLFCDDFRINDNPALHYAVRDYENVVLLYIYNEGYLGRNLGLASKVFLHEVLKSFDNLLFKKYNVHLIIKKGDYVSNLKDVSNQINFDAIYFNHSYNFEQIKVEDRIREEFRNLDVKSFKGKLLFEPWQIKPASDVAFYKVFTPFSKECLRNVNLVGDLHLSPEEIKSVHNLQTLHVNDLKLLPEKQGRWFDGLLKNWNFLHEEVERNFLDFANSKLGFYKEDRNFPNKNSTSCVSAYLRFGVLSPRFCFDVACKKSSLDNHFISELLWREFAYHVMFYNQSFVKHELKSEYKSYVWDNSEVFFEKWKNGETGFDIVDAGMTELLKTGVIHNRVRMVTASFLIKDLFIDWKLGEEWFWDTLVDADPAVNPFSWQWVFGSGFDAAPYFRIFNPDSQREKFDPDGSYCKKWLSKDWKCDRIVSHDIQRNIALERYKAL